MMNKLIKEFEKFYKAKQSSPDLENDMDCDGLDDRDQEYKDRYEDFIYGLKEAKFTANGIICYRHIAVPSLKAFKEKFAKDWTTGIYWSFDPEEAEIMWDSAPGTVPDRYWGDQETNYELILTAEIPFNSINLKNTYLQNMTCMIEEEIQVKPNAPVKLISIRNAIGRKIELISKPIIKKAAVDAQPDLKKVASELRKIASELKKTASKTSTTWYHGAGAKYDSLIPGEGIDGEGVYLTKNKQRAEMYSKRDKHGKDNKTPYIHEVKVNIPDDKVCDKMDVIDLRDYTNAKWLTDLIEQYGEQVCHMNWMNAKIYLGFTNEDLKKLGYKAFLSYEDLIVFDPKDIEIVGGYYL